MHVNQRNNHLNQQRTYGFHLLAMRIDRLRYNPEDNSVNAVFSTISQAREEVDNLETGSITRPRSDNIRFENPNLRNIDRTEVLEQVQQLFNNHFDEERNRYENIISEDTQNSISRLVQERNDTQEIFRGITDLVNFTANQMVARSLQDHIEGRDARPRIRLNRLGNPQDANR